MSEVCGVGLVVSGVSSVLGISLRQHVQGLFANLGFCFGTFCRYIYRCNNSLDVETGYMFEQLSQISNVPPKCTLLGDHLPPESLHSP